MVSALEQFVDRAARRRAGVVAATLAGDDTDVAARGDDGHGGTPTGRTLFEIGSVTKVFTSLLLADGAVRGEWRLDTPVAELLPGHRIPQRDGVPITLEHLATHTSGLPRSPLPNLGGSIDMLRGRDPYAGLTSDGLLERVGRMRLRRTPGTGKVAYSNTGAGLLGEAMARTTGLPYDELVRIRICAPLGMADTVTYRQRGADQCERTAHGHHGRRRPAPAWPLTGLMGAGALLSTADDLLRFARVQVAPAGTQLDEAIELTQMPRPGRPGTIGLGWMYHPAGPLLWHNGGTGGFRSVVGLLPSRRVAVVALTNHARGLTVAGLRWLRRSGAAA